MNRIAVIGCGYWGPNFVRNFSQIPDCEVAVCCDLREERLRHMRSLYPFVRTTTHLDRVLEDPTINAAVIATPVTSHHRIGMACLRAGKNVLIEKPIAASPREAYELAVAAKERGLVLMGGHTFLFNAAVIKVKEYIESGELGKIFYINSTRVNLGIFQDDINVIWDLAPHDISILNFVLNSRPVRVAAYGRSYIQTAIEDVAFITLEYPKGVVAHVHVSWLDPNKIRRTTIVGSKKMLVYDDIQTLEKVRIYDKGVTVQPHYDTFGEFQLAYRFGDIYTPKVDDSEPLKLECHGFIDSIKKGKALRSGGEECLWVVEALDAAQRSLRLGGKLVEVRDMMGERKSKKKRVPRPRVKSVKKGSAR
ncbi:MAG: Gfo/Idh/MocA family protein [bacterium]